MLPNFQGLLARLIFLTSALVCNVFGDLEGLFVVLPVGVFMLEDCSRIGPGQGFFPYGDQHIRQHVDNFVLFYRSTLKRAQYLKLHTDMRKAIKEGHLQGPNVCYVVQHPFNHVTTRMGFFVIVNEDREDALPIAFAQEELQFLARSRGGYNLHLIPLVIYTNNVVAFDYNPHFFYKDNGLGHVGRYIGQALEQRINGRPLGNISDTFTLPTLDQAMGYFHSLQLKSIARKHFRRWLSRLDVVIVWIPSDKYFLCKARNKIHKPPQQAVFQRLYYNLRQVVTDAAAPAPYYGQ